MKLRLVLDTNIYISAVLFKGKPNEVLNLAIFEEVEVFISPDILWEIESVFRKKFFMDQLTIKTIIGEIQDFARLVIPSKVFKTIDKNPADNRILECALEAKADFIVSGDKKHLLSIGQFKNIPIISAKEFLDLYYGKKR